VSFFEQLVGYMWHHCRPGRSGFIAARSSR